MLIDGCYPSHVTGGQGAKLFDERGLAYIDYMGGLGAALFGYDNQPVFGALSQGAKHGFSHSLPTIFEIEAAEALKEIFCFVDRFKFLKTGTEACMGAVKIARNATGRNLILTDGYHGWSDEFMHLHPPACGIPEGYAWSQKLESLEQISKEVAAVIVEPVITDYSKERIHYLNKLYSACKKAGALLIFDEVITGFRFKKHSVARWSNVTPDLIILGKAMANGMPLSAIGGKKEIMDDMAYFVSSTYAGEAGSLAVCKRVCELLVKNPQYSVDELWIKGQRFIDHFNSLGPIQIEGYPTRGVLTSKNPDDVYIFMQEAARCYLLFCKSWFYGFENPKEEPTVWLAIEQIQKNIADNKVNLEYDKPMLPWAAKIREEKKNERATSGGDSKRRGKRKTSDNKD